MLNVPPINKLMENVDSKYTLVIISSKRARAVIENNPEMMASGLVNPVSCALNEIADGKIKWSSAEEKAWPEALEVEE